jgi:hypothetical protein
MLKKPALLKSVLVLSILANILFAREVIKYEPPLYKFRIYNKLKQAGWFDKSQGVEKLPPDSTAYMLTLGQSNAGNSSSALDTASANAYSYYKGQLYRAEDPLIGAPGVGGSVWTLLADKIIANKLYKRVVIIPIAVGSTDAQSWADGDCSKILSNALADLKKHHIVLTHILWQEGESDNGSSKLLYKRNLGKVLRNIRRNGQPAPFYCAISSYTNDAQSMPKGIDLNIQNAQREFAKENKGVFEGPNTDTINEAIDRHDSIHFSKTGKRKYADLWFASIFQTHTNDQ